MTRTPTFDSYQDEIPPGVVKPPPHDQWRLRRWQASPLLTPYVKWYWMAEWKLADGEPFETMTLPHIAPNLVVENSVPTVYGSTTGAFRRALRGTGATVGVSFTPAGFSAFTSVPLSHLTNGHFPAREVLDLTSEDVVALVTRHVSPEHLLDTFEQILRRLVPSATDPKLSIVNKIVDSIRADSTLLTVDDVASLHNLSRRTLQRLFTEYVGVGVKTVIRRHRLQEIALITLRSEAIDWADLAIKMGYSDQAHLVRDFNKTMGISPAKHHQRRLRTTAEETLLRERP